MHRITRILALALLVVPVVGLVPAATAFGQNDPGGGVTVDPNSPSGTEYDIPLERARRESEGKQKKNVTAGSQSSPLFGEGVQSQATPSAQTPATTAGPTAAEKAKAKAKAKKAKAEKARAKAKREAIAARKRKERAAKEAKAKQRAAAAKAKADERRAVAEQVANEAGGAAPSAAAALGGGVLLIAGLGGWLLRRRSS
jgi:hypothetical protein